MATFVEITPDAFNEGFKKVGEDAAFYKAVGGGRTPQYHVRRPVRGIQIKENTYATLQVRTADGRNLPLFDAAGTIYGDDGSKRHAGQTLQNSNFILQSASETRAEKVQVVQTFGEPYFFFFGEQPRVVTVSGLLLNTEDFNWRAEWWANYEQYLRGTACVRSRTRVYLSWDDIIVEGYISQASATDEASNQNLVQFQFQMFLTNYYNISSIGDAFAHMAFKSIDLSPDEVEFLSSIGKGYSVTAAVREENILMAQRLEAGLGGNSLLGTLRSASASVAVAAGTGRLLEVNGEVIDFLADASRFIAGRNIRVPIGFEGSAAFDDAQIALASIPGASSVISGEERTVSIRRTIAGRSYLIEGTLGPKSVPAHYGGLYENEDEFVARYSTSSVGKREAPELYRNQTFEASRAGEKVRDAFKAFGVDVEPPNEVLLMVARAAFGIASIAVGSLLLDAKRESGTARFVSNLL